MANSINDTWRSRLGRVACEHARAALEAYQRQAYELFYVEAGIALELAMKARLATVTPYLLAPNERGWFRQGFNLAKGDTQSGARSVSAKDALDRLKSLEPELIAGIAPLILATVERRDQSVHLGVFSQPSGAELLAHAATFVEAINGLVPDSPEVFWGDSAVLAAELVAAERSAVRVRVAGLIAAARTRLATLTGEEREVLGGVATQYYEDYQDEIPDLVVVTCPVCASDALATGELTDDGEPVWDRDPEPIAWAYEINTVLTGFECKVCRLRLSSAEEIAASDLPTKVANEHVDPSMLYERDPEPW